MCFDIFYSVLSYFLNAGHDPLADFMTCFWVATYNMKYCPEVYPEIKGCGQYF